MRTSLLLLLGMLLAVSPLSALSQASGGGAKKIGLALSGGGAKGFAHIGVLKVLEEEGIPVHVVAGSSMGAIIGGLYAAGYSPSRIEEIILDLEWQTLFNDTYRAGARELSSFNFSRDTYLLSLPLDNRRLRLPSGLIDGQNFSRQLYRLTLPWHGIDDFSRLPVSFAAVATDLETGRIHRLDSGYLPEAIRASAAIPTVFKPVVIDGRAYIDGGVSRNIPASDTRALGADRVIISNVGEPVKPADSLRTLVDILFQAVGYHQQESDSVQIPLGDVHIRPDIESFSSFSYDHAPELIRKGEEAARAMLPRIRSMMDSVEVQQPPDRPAPDPDYGEPIRIAGVSYRSPDRRLARQVETALDIEPPQMLSYDALEHRINRLYATGLFSLITYRLLPVTADGRVGGRILELSFRQSEPDQGLFSLRYDSPYKASLLFGARFRHAFGWGDRLTTELRLGEILGFTSHYDLPLALRPAIGFHAEMGVFRSPVDLYEGDSRLSSVEVEQLGLLPSLSLRPADRWNLQAGVRAEFYNLNEAVGNILLFEDSRFLLNGVLQAGFNSRDRGHFPRRGHRLRLLGEAGHGRLDGDGAFGQLMMRWQSALPLAGGVTLLGDLAAGLTLTGEPPLHYRYYLGGVSANPLFSLRQLPLMGYGTQQLSGSQMARAQARLQLHLGDDFYLTAGWNAARAAEDWKRRAPDWDLRHGWGLSVGALTLIGPASVTLSTPDFRHNYAVKVSVGHSF